MIAHNYLSQDCYHHQHQNCQEGCAYCGHGCICSCHARVECKHCLDAPPKNHTCPNCGRTA